MDTLATALISAPGDTLAALSSLPLDPGKRLFWGFLLSSLILGWLVLAWRHGTLRPRALLNKTLPAGYWRHPSHLVDLGLLLLNTLLRLALLVPLFGGHVLATLWVARLWQGKLGSAPELAWHGAAIIACYTFAFFLLEDLSRFGLHRAMHRVPLLWRLHRVHHSAEVLSPLTLHRVHPLEMALYYLRGMLVFGAVSGTFVWLFGRQVDGIDILGVDALGFLFNAAGANLRHSPVWVGFGHLERIFVSPAQHQLHHSAAAAHQDRNFGTCLAIWDRLGGTWLPAGRPQTLSFGLKSSESPTAVPAT